MKKIISSILSLAIVISLCPQSLAFDVSHQKDMSVEHSTAFETALDIFSSSEEYVSTGQTIYTFYRTRNYWKAYNSANGKATYENRGSSYYGGRTMGNSPTIEYAISKHVEDNL